MFKSKYIFALIFVIFLPTKNSLSQVWTAGDNITLQVSAYCLIETNYAPVSLSLNTSTPGEPVTSSSNSDLFVKISSIVPGGTDREITARISSGAVPAGTKLTLVSAPCTTSNSGGELGTPISTPITLTSTDQFLVLGIASCYTGTGYTDGYQMTFTWAPDNPSLNYALIEANTTNITVVFTITAHDGN